MKIPGDQQLNTHMSPEFFAYTMDFYPHINVYSIQRFTVIDLRCLLKENHWPG